MDNDCRRGWRCESSMGSTPIREWLSITRMHRQGTEVSHVVARTTSDPASTTAAIIHLVNAINPDVPVYDVATMEQRVQDSMARQRFAMTMLGGFAGFAMILAAIGIYGVMSFLVTQGTADIAIRMAPARAAQASSPWSSSREWGWLLWASSLDSSGRLG